MEGRGASSRGSRSHVRIKRSFFIFLSLLYSHFLPAVGGLYSNCAAEVTMIAFYCPLSPQVSARKVLCVLVVEREKGGDKACGGEGLSFSPGGFRI